MQATALARSKGYLAAAADNAARHRDAYFLGFIALVAVRLWLGPLSSSLWLDETGTHWTVQNGLAGIAQRACSPPQSLLYFYIAGIAAALGGANEVALRLPSLVAVALAALVLYRLAVRLMDREGALWTVLVFVSWREVCFAACDARPYAPGLLAVTGAVLMLIRWLETGRSGDALGYAIVAALTVYLHYLFAVMYVVHAMYAAYIFGTRRRALPLVSAGVVLAATAALLTPLYRGFAGLVSQAPVLSYAREPGRPDLISAWAPPVLCGSIAAGLLAAYVLFPRGRLAAQRDRVLGLPLMVLWAAVPPAALFAVSVLTPYQVFVPRYLLCYVPGVALLAGMGLRTLALPHKQVIVAAALAVGVAGAFGSLRYLGYPHTPENWRDANAEAARIVREKPMPVLMHSGFGLPVNDVLRGDPLASSRYLSPLSLYPIPGEVLPLPYEPGRAASEYLDGLAATKLAPAGRFLLVTRNMLVAVWIQGRLTGTFENTRTAQFGDVSVLLFEGAVSSRSPAVHLPVAGRL